MDVQDALVRCRGARFRFRRAVARPARRRPAGTARCCGRFRAGVRPSARAASMLISRAAAWLMRMTRSSASMASTPSTMLERMASRSLRWRTTARSLSSSSAAMWLSVSARAPISSESATGRRWARSPRANRSAPCLSCSSGRAMRRECSRLTAVNSAATSRLHRPMCRRMLRQGLVDGGQRHRGPHHARRSCRPAGKARPRSTRSP